MYDKTIRRRRAVLGVLIALALITLTAYFGEPAGGGLHSVQRGFLTVISPIQDGASKALKPVRDLFGWAGDTLAAKGQRDQLRKEVQQLESANVANEAGAREYAQLAKIMRVDQVGSISNYNQVIAHVIGRSPTLFYETVELDHGTSSGIHAQDPVIDGDGLIGHVTLAAPDSAIVTLITDPSSGVSAVDNRDAQMGIVQPALGDPNSLLLSFIAHPEQVQPGDMIVTSGSITSKLDSLYPRDLPIGRVTNVDPANLDASVRLAPFADLRNLDIVQVLTGGHAAAASTTALVPGG